MTPVTGKTKRLWAYIRPYWKWELLTFLIMIILAVLSLAVPRGMQYLIDDLIPSLQSAPSNKAALSSIVMFAVILMGVFLVILLLSWIKDYLASRIGAKITAAIRLDLFDRLQRLSLRFHAKHQVGEIMSRFMSDVGRIQELLTTTALSFMRDLFQLIAVFVYLDNINLVLTLVALIPVPLSALLTDRFGKKMRVVNKNYQETTASLSARIQEALMSVRTIKVFAQEESESRKLRGFLGRLVDVSIHYGSTISLARNFMQFSVILGPIVILAWGGYLVSQKSLTLGELMAFVMLLNVLYSPIQNLASANVEVQTAMASVDRVLEYLDNQEEIKEDAQPVYIHEAKGEVGFGNVSFSYDDDNFTLRDFTLTIPARQTLAIVGPSGSGKTTIINLIMRLFDPNSGAVTLDGIDLRKLSRQSLRSHIALVDQDPFLFNASIFENIAYSKPDASKEEVTTAAKAANIHEYVAGLANGYETIVGERGVTLSGGEKQRICLARAILKNPTVLILDEATSALDSISERLIQNSLDILLKNKTAIIIAHRLSTVQNADRIITLSSGKIIADGSHADLMKTSSLYQELAARQFTA